MGLQNKKILFFCVGVCTLFWNQDAFGRRHRHRSYQRRLGDSDYGTHIFALMVAVLNTTGPVLEMGCGNFSTPLLHAVCSVNKRLLVSAEADAAWLNGFISFETSWHQFKGVSISSQAGYEWDSIGNDTHWSVVLIDHTPVARRSVDIMRLRKNTDIFVVHDSQDPRPYGYDTIYPPFKYSYTYDYYFPSTTLYSDVIDVAAFFK